LNGKFPGKQLLRCYNFGDPMRCPGICRGNQLAGLPVPKLLDGFTTGGIAGTGDLTAAQSDLVFSCNNDGDLYGAAPVGDDPWHKISGVGKDEEMIFNLIQNFLDLGNLTALATEALGLFSFTLTGLNLASVIAVVTGVLEGALGGGGIPGIPGTGVQNAQQVVSVLLALLNGGMFVFSGMGPHGDYGKYVPALVQDALAIGKRAYSLAA
jgi:hypothetical protein